MYYLILLTWLRKEFLVLIGEVTVCNGITRVENAGNSGTELNIRLSNSGRRGKRMWFPFRLNGEIYKWHNRKDFLSESYTCTFTGNYFKDYQNLRRGVRVGLRGTPGERVYGSRTQGSNPCLSAIKYPDLISVQAGVFHFCIMSCSPEVNTFFLITNK